MASVRAVAESEAPVLYFKRGCTSCEKARAWLAAHGISVVEREIFKRPLTASEIEDVIGPRAVTDVLSTRTTEYRARGLDQVTAQLGRQRAGRVAGAVVGQQHGVAVGDQGASHRRAGHAQPDDQVGRAQSSVPVETKSA